ncbi:MAG: Fur family transcriptional regulator [Oscillospiraceae bacterium]
MNENQLAWPAGMKKTKQRKRVFSVLERADSPLSAMDIYKQIEKDDSSFWLSTVYRILELFANEGLVVKTTVMGNNMTLYELNRNKHRHYAVCVNCRKVVEMDNCPMEKFIPEFAESDFRVLGHKVEMYGYCKECDAKISKRHE